MIGLSSIQAADTISRTAIQKPGYSYYHEEMKSENRDFPGPLEWIANFIADAHRRHQEIFREIIASFRSPANVYSAPYQPFYNNGTVGITTTHSSRSYGESREYPYSSPPAATYQYSRRHKSGWQKHKPATRAKKVKADKKDRQSDKK